MTRIASAMAAVTALALSGCEKPPPNTVTSPEKPTSGISNPAAMKDFIQSAHGGDAAPTGAQAPPGQSPTSDAVPAAAPGARPEPLANQPPEHRASADLKFTVPADWKSQPPSSGMRKAQYVIPRAEGDAADGEMIVYFFGKNEGGNVTSNLVRWRGMFTNSDGTPLPESASKTETFDVSNLKVTLLDVAGRYAPAAMPAAPATPPQDHYRMLAAIVETPGGPWFFKGVGPAATMEQNRAAVIEMLKSAKY